MVVYQFSTAFQWWTQAKATVVRHSAVGYAVNGSESLDVGKVVLIWKFSVAGRVFLTFKYHNIKMYGRMEACFTHA
jgi:hypothetical protein